MRKDFLLILVFSFFCSVSFAQSESHFSFIENKGQWHERVKYYGQLNAGGFFLEENGYTVLLHNAAELQDILHRHHARSERGNNGSAEQNVLHSHAYRVQFVGANKDAVIIPEKKEPGFSNYFIGNDPRQWASHCNSYSVVTYKNIYPNIDLRFYADEGRLKYDFIVYPGGRVEQIAMQFDGIDRLAMSKKDLIVTTSVGEVKELSPFAFQFDKASNARNKVACTYRITGNKVGFEMGKYTPDMPLVIDPTLVFASFTGSTVDNWGFSATPGPDGTTYFAGIVFGGGFPVSPGAFQTNYQGGDAQRIDIGVMKLSADGSTRLYATYLGGSSDEYPHSLVADADGNLVVAGRTYSGNYPVTKAVVGPGGGADIILTKLTADGTALIGSMRIGGSGNDGVNIEGQHRMQSHRSNSLIQFYGDDSRSEVILDAGGNIYLASHTQSVNFPVTAGVFQNSYGGGLQDGVVLKVNSFCNTLLFSGFLGGTKEDGAFVLALQPNSGDIYVAGATASTDFPGGATGSIQPAYAGGIADGFIAIVSNDGTSLKKSTYLGTNAVDVIYGIQFDKAGFPYVMGTTRGSWPVLNVTFVNPGAKQFVSKLNPDLSAFIYSTTFGTNSPVPNISPVAFLVDRCENVYISGWGGFLVPNQDPYGQAGTYGMPVTPDAMKPTTDGYDFYFIVIKKNASQLLYGSYYGQDGGMVNDHVDGGTSRYDPNGVIHQAICANCGGGAFWPTTPGSWSPQNGTGGRACNLAVVKIAFNYAGVGSGVKAYVNSKADSSGCVPFTVTLKDTVLNAVRYEWNFGDGSPEVETTNATFTYTYNKVGIYKVRLVAIDSTTCNIRDTSYTTIRVRDDQVYLAFQPNKLPPCESLSYRFENFSVAPATKPLTTKIFTWDFGDGVRQNAAGLTPVTHTYAAAGTYRVRLILTDTSYCNTPDSIEQVVRLSSLVKADFSTPAGGCAPYTAVFTNTSLGGQSFQWDFGDGSTSNNINPVHDYTAGTYRVRLVVIDSATCNIADTTYQTIAIVNKPVAGISHTPVIPAVNNPVIFSNTSTGAVRYVWLFGDGELLQTPSADIVSHQYNATGIFDVQLIAINRFECSDTVHHVVQAIVEPLVDVPNAFTPGRFGINSVVQVRGYGITKMIFRIYNRWGEKVFETTNRLEGWDGTYKGVLQPMDVYAYTLEVEFSDGTKGSKKGDITLIR